ncbi:MAG: VOC family protein, partial [Afipia sp.]|nr:VOC family protein [Afipia sp.]
IAFWDLSGVPGCEHIRTDISRGLGLDALTNHIAFQADDLDDLARRKQRWLSCGKEVIEIDHGWIHSVYTEDPDGIMVEFAVVTRPLTETDIGEALERGAATGEASDHRECGSGAEKMTLSMPVHYSIFPVATELAARVAGRMTRGWAAMMAT